MANRKSVLLKTSSNADVQYSGGEVIVTGFEAVSKRDIVSIQQTKYRVEIPQVVRVGGGTYTPTASTRYSVAIVDPNRTVDGGEEKPYIYSYETPAVLTTIGANAQDQRDAIHAALAVKINAQSDLNRSTAAAAAAGAGLDITDAGGYYPVRAQNQTKMRGPNSVFVKTNSDGSGFVSSGVSVTTEAVVSFGVGAKLAQEAPVLDAMFGNAISGNLIDPPTATDGTYATSGQKYDGFTITSLQKQWAPTITGHYTYIDRVQNIYVDNGTGSATTNLAGFLTFERAMQKLAVSTMYGEDANTVQEWFDSPIVFQDPLGAAPTGTANTLGWQLSKYGGLNRTNIGTQTIVVPVLDANGLLIDQDDTGGEGSHTSAPQQALCDQSYIVGKTEFMMVFAAKAGDWTDTHFIGGFRKKAVYAADFNDYTDLAAIGTRVSGAGDVVATLGILNNAATKETVSTDVLAVDAGQALCWIKVAIDGTVTAYANGVQYPIYSAGTTTLVLDEGDEMIPFYQHVNIAAGDPALSINRFFSVASTNLIV